MENKTSTLTKIIIAGIVILVIWGFFLHQREVREATIISAVEQACEHRSLDIDCLDFSYDVVNIYKDLNVSDPRDYGE